MRIDYDDNNYKYLFYSAESNLGLLFNFNDLIFSKIILKYIIH